MTNAEELEKEVKGLEVITFRSVLGKTQGKLTVCPARSKRTGRLMGVENLSDEQRKTLPYVVDEQTSIDIFDGFELNLSNNIDRINWEWIKHLPELVPNLEASYSNPSALFYVENLEKDTDDRIKRRKVKSDAFKYLEEASAVKKVEICRMLGLDATSMKPRDIDDYLGEIADVNPKRLVNAFEDKDIKVKLFLYRLLDMRIVTIDQSGVYSWGTKILGVNEGSVLVWLQLRENAAYVSQLHAEAYPSAPKFDNNGDSFEPDGKKDDKTSQVENDPLIAQLARDEYEKLYGKKAGNMSLENIIKKVNEAKANQGNEDEL